jgi:TfoX/Sxy family transcriptional regulator of competence genes
LADYSEKLEDLLDHYLIANEELIKKKQLGGVGYLLNGNMCLGIYNDFLVVRAGKSLAETLISWSGIEPYMHDEDDLEEFILVAPKIYNHSKALHKFVDQGIEYTASLPPKKQDDLGQDLSP